MILWMLSLGCRDPQLAPLKDALDAYDAGRAALAAGDAPAAAQAFGRAVAADPQSPSLPAWQAWAQEKTGDEAGARRTLEQALGRFPEDTTLRYNHAALLARAGELEAAADDLRQLYAAGAIEPEEVGEDPDFQAFAEDPELAPLAPPPAVVVSVQGESGAILLGELYTLDLSILSRAHVPISLSDLGEPTGLLRHVRTVEDLAPAEGSHQGRTLSVSWRAVSAGEATLGPWLVDAGGTSTITDKAAVRVVAVPGRSGGVAEEAGSVYAVSALVEGRTAPWAGRAHGGVLVLSPPGARAEVEAENPDPDPVQLELRDNGQTSVAGQLYRIPGPARVRVRVGESTLLDQDIPADRPVTP